MSETEQAILNLASQTTDNPEGFRTLENVFEKAQDSEKAGYFLQIGILVYNRSYFILGLASWLLHKDG